MAMVLVLDNWKGIASLKTELKVNNWKWKLRAKYAFSAYFPLS